MAIEIIDLTHRVGRIQIGIPGIAATEITEAEGVEVLEHLARILDFTLLDREERASLLELADEVEQKRGPGGTTDVAYAGVALARAVNHSLRTDDPQEV